MAAELVTPTDALSGLPLPLLPTEEVLPIDQGNIANWHHHFHPRTHPILLDTTGGRALRSARIQLVASTQHNYSNNAYHKFYAGPPIPEDQDTQFGLCVLACAGFMPEEAIDISSGEPEIVHMSEVKLERLRMQPAVLPPWPSQVDKYQKQRFPEATVEQVTEILYAKWSLQAQLSYRNLRYGYDPMKAFFTEVILDQDLSHLPGSIIQEFAEKGTMEPGMVLLAQAAVQAVETSIHRGHKVSELYRLIREAGYLHPGMPPNAASLVKYKLGDLSIRTSLLPGLRQRLIDRGLGGPAKLVAA